MKIVQKCALIALTLFLCRPLDAAISGQVFDHSNEPIQGAKVVLTNVSKPDLVFAVLTDSRGYFSIDTVPNGVYWLLATAVGFETEEPVLHHIHFPKGLDIAFFLTPKGASDSEPRHSAEVWGELSGSSGPLGGAKVCLSGNGQETCTLTNRLGQYSLSLAPGAYSGYVVWKDEVKWKGILSLDQAKDYADAIEL